MTRRSRTRALSWWWMSMASDKEKREAALQEDGGAVYSFLRHHLSEDDPIVLAHHRIIGWGQRERDEVEREIVFWALTQSDDQAYYGCMTGDCPHTKREECIQSVQDELRRRRAEADGG